MSIHVLGGGVRNDVGAPLKGTAHHGRREGVVDHQRHAVVMRGLGKALNIEHGKGRVGNRLAKDELGIGLKGCLQLLIGAVGGDKRASHAHAAHGVGEQVIRTAVDSRARDHVITGTGHVKDREEVRGHARTREHRSGAALHLADLGGNQIARGILQTAVEVARLLQVKQLAHVLGRVVFPRGGLVDGHLARLRIARMIAALNARGTDSLLAHIQLPYLGFVLFGSRYRYPAPLSTHPADRLWDKLIRFICPKSLESVRWRKTMRYALRSR